ncbi:MAG: Bax inhibitor-1/YccA family protein [Lewinellaceae bacterium]|nr:Bax inhibitor-1/YccA family protein [Saprospiraceae bacterium]MCB9338110.1 Bax inhibitor-1/YccA family protein [Lewinellaceae bacterium]
MFSSSNNPFMKEEAYRKSSNEILDAGLIDKGERMTVQGAINKSFILFGIMMLTTLVSFAYPSPLFMWGGAIGGLVVVLIASFKTHLSATLAPIYALLEGLCVGSVTAIYAAGFGGGIIFHAVTLTFALLFAMLFIYKTGIIKVTNKFRTGVVMATGAVLLVYLLSFVLGFFGISVPYLHQGGMIGIGISLVIIGVATLNLLLDFDNFEKGEQYGAPAYMEWFSAMGLLITLVWLYFEILRLLSILNRD